MTLKCRQVGELARHSALSRKPWERSRNERITMSLCFERLVWRVCGNVEDE